jgi:hypothetical protein
VAYEQLLVEPLEEPLEEHLDELQEEPLEELQEEPLEALIDQVAYEHVPHQLVLLDLHLLFSELLLLF